MTKPGSMSSRNRNCRRRSDRAGRRLAGRHQHADRRNGRLHLLLGLALLLAFDNWRTGMGWESDGPQAGYFPFYLSIILAAASLYGLVTIFLSRAGCRRNLRHPRPASPRDAGFRSDIPVLPVHAMARALRRELRIDRRLHVDGRPHRAMEIVAYQLRVYAAMFVTFEIAFDVIMPKGPLEALFGYYEGRDSHGSFHASHSRLYRSADLEDARPDDGRAGARHFRWRVAGTGWAERRCHFAAAHVHDGSDIRHRDAVLHLLGCAVRRRHHVDPVQYSRRSLVGGDDVRWLSDGPAGQGGGSAHSGLHVFLHRLAVCRAAHHVSRARHRVFRTAVRAAGILRGLSAHLLLVRRSGPRSKAQDHHFDGARPAACRCRHGHRLRPIAHDLRLQRSAARHQFPGRGDRAVRHQRNSAHHGGAAGAARPCGAHQPARAAGKCGKTCRATG